MKTEGKELQCTKLQDRPRERCGKGSGDSDRTTQSHSIHRVHTRRRTHSASEPTKGVSALVTQASRKRGYQHVRVVFVANVTRKGGCILWITRVINGTRSAHIKVTRHTAQRPWRTWHTTQVAHSTDIRGHVLQAL